MSHTEEFSEFLICEHLPPIAFKFPLLHSSSSDGNNDIEMVDDWVLKRKMSITALSDWSLSVLFSVVDMDTLLKVLHLLILETPTIIVGSKTGSIASVVLGLAHLLGPLVWVGPFIPMLPASMGELLDAPGE